MLVVVVMMAMVLRKEIQSWRSRLGLLHGWQRRGVLEWMWTRRGRTVKRREMNREAQVCCWNG